LSKLRITRWEEHVARTGDIINAYIVSVRKFEGKGSLGKPRRRLEDEMQLYLKRTEYGVEWI
jgi:hypothetical protein